MDDKVKRLKEIIEQTNNLVFFGGAGVSTESGIPDFRSTDGLYNLKYKYPPETIVSHTFFVQKTEEFYEFYKDKMMALDAKPNKAHEKLAQWEKEGKCRAVITQNIDGLHQMAGSQKVMEMHGSIHRNYCTRSGKIFEAAYVKNSASLPVCDDCGGLIKPDVVLYEEGLDSQTISDAVYAISHADVLIIGGTSLAVYPAAGMIDYFRGKHLILINKSSTPRDGQADLIINDSIGEVLGAL